MRLFCQNQYCGLSTYGSVTQCDWALSVMFCAWTWVQAMHRACMSQDMIKLVIQVLLLHSTDTG